MARASRWVALCVGVLIGLLLVMSAASNRAYTPHSRNVRLRQALLQTIGLPSMAISADCSATKSLSEGLGGCLSDNPAGYCYHTSCDTVCAPEPVEQDVFRLRIEP